MDIRLCQNKEEWDQYLLTREQSSFLQSWEWGEFQRAVGHRPLRIVAGGAQARCQLQGFKHNLGLGVSYLYVPRMQNNEVPTLRSGSRIVSIGKFRMQNICEFVKNQGYSFIRVEPKAELQATSYKLQAVHNRQPQHTLILDLSQPAAELLSAMHPKTRYNIGLAERKGVVVKEEKNVDTFWRLNRETTVRGEWRSHPREYYAKMLELDMAHQLTAEYQGEPIASNILIHFGDTMTYLHGASSQTHRDVMAPYLLQWRGIELAQRLGCKQYDFWGAARLSRNMEHGTQNTKPLTTFHNHTWEANHKWSGITRFKAGFGGTPVSYGQAVDVVLQTRKYKMYRLLYRMHELRTMI